MLAGWAPRMKSGNEAIPGTCDKASSRAGNVSPVVLPKSPVFTPVRTISFTPVAAISSACFTTSFIGMFRLPPLARERYSKYNGNHIRPALLKMPGFCPCCRCRQNTRGKTTLRMAGSQQYGTPLPAFGNLNGSVPESRTQQCTYAFHVSQHLRSELCRTPCYHNKGLRILPEYFTYGLPALFIGMFRNGTRIDDIDICLGRRSCLFIAIANIIPGNGGTFCIIEFTA